MRSFKRVAAILTLSAAGALSTSGFAQTFPTQAIKIVVPTTAGGSYDVLARQLSDKLATEIGQAIVVENRTGAGTVVGTQAVAQAPADGYTLLLGGLSNIVLNHGLYERLPYKALDFVPVAMVGATSYTLIARKDLPVSNLRELVDYAKAHPGQLNVATAGIGTGQHVVAALLKSVAGIDLIEIPYKGAQPVYTDMLGGRVDLFFDSTFTAKPFIDSAKVKAIANSGPIRDELEPQIPTAKESGFPGLVMEGWLGVFAPAKTPPAVVDKLRAAVVKTVRTPELQQRLKGFGIRPTPMTPQETDKFLQAEMQKWPPFLHKAGIRAD